MSRSSKPTDRGNCVFLIGFAGSGKSTVGPLLARLLDCAFADLDMLIEKRAGLTVSEIFKVRGQVFFRRLERKVLLETIARSRQRLVIALGGGAFLSPGSQRFAAANGLVIYLSCSVRELARRLKHQTDRPLLNPKHGRNDRSVGRNERLKQMLEARLPGYHLADMRISTTARSPRQTATAIYRTLQRRYAPNSR